MDKSKYYIFVWSDFIHGSKLKNIDITVSTSEMKGMFESTKNHLKLFKSNGFISLEERLLLECEFSRYGFVLAGFEKTQHWNPSRLIFKYDEGITELRRVGTIDVYSNDSNKLIVKSQSENLYDYSSTKQIIEEGLKSYNNCRNTNLCENDIYCKFSVRE